MKVFKENLQAFRIAMEIFHMQVICIYSLCLSSTFILFPPGVICSVTAPRNSIRNVGQDVLFMWNTTNGNDISSTKWGLLESDGDIKPEFIYISTRTNGPVFHVDLDTIAISYKGRVSWVGNTSAGHAWFKITNLTLQDTNQYVASIREQGQSEPFKYPTYMTVAAPPQFNPQPPLRKNIAEGQDLSVPCTAVGPPTPNITWVQIAGHMIKSTGNGSATLRIPNIRRDQNGTYECQARNNPNERPVTAQTVVTVYFKPVIDDSQSSSKATSWNGNSIRLRCFATGLPAPQISWYKPTNQQITTGVNIVPGGSEVTVLTTADQGDYGQYKCRAINFLGSDEHVINVTQLFAPGLVTISITELDASSFTVRWTNPADHGGLAVTGYLLEVSTKPPVFTVNTHVVITGLKANTQYTVQVYARNVVGYGAVSAKPIRTKAVGKPSIPQLLAALLERKDSKLSVVLRWSKPDDNGGNITRYTIYMKEVARKAEWTKHDDVPESNRFEYRITKNIVYGKTYMFMMTAWNKHGESVRDEGSAKTVNTTAGEVTATNGLY